MTFTVHETDLSCKTCGWILGHIEAATKDEALALALAQFKPKHRGRLWVQYPSDYLNRNCKVNFSGRTK